MKKYKAAVYEDVRNIKVVELTLPECGDDDIIVKNIFGGICGSDLTTYQQGGGSRSIEKGSELGHEMISEVIQIGKNVKTIAVGDHVWPQYGMAKRDMKRAQSVGGFSEYVHIPQFELGYSAIKIDKSIDSKIAVLFEPFTIGAKVVDGVKPIPGQTAIVYGAGIIGMSSAIMLKWFGCDKVMIVDKSDFRLAKAAQFDLITCNNTKENLREKAFAEFGSQQSRFGTQCKCDIYIEAIGDAIGENPNFMFDDYLAIGARCSVMGVAGVHHASTTIDLGRFALNNLTIRGCGGSGTDQIAQPILDLMTSGKYPLASLVTHEFAVEKINEAMAMAANSEKAQKVIISFM